MKIAGFDWDEGNWLKCGKHGVSQQEIEDMLWGNPVKKKDPNPAENRLRAIGQTEQGRYIFVVYVERVINGVVKLRPLSARYMHQKEINYYAEEKANALPANR